MPEFDVVVYSVELFISFYGLGYASHMVESGCVYGLGGCVYGLNGCVYGWGWLDSDHIIKRDRINDRLSVN